jgi:hypothetical protein
LFSLSSTLGPALSLLDELSAFIFAELLINADRWKLPLDGHIKFLLAGGKASTTALVESRLWHL